MFIGQRFKTGDKVEVVKCETNPQYIGMRFVVMSSRSDHTINGIPDLPSDYLLTEHGYSNEVAYGFNDDMLDLVKEG